MTQHPTKQMIKHQQTRQVKKGNTEGLSWWQFSLVGIGSIIGAGFFLGTGLSIKTAGPSVLIGYLLAGVAAFFVFGSLAGMTVHDPVPGSFRTYARKAFGHTGGFLSGWVYWIAGVLIMSSEITALSIFTQFWFPKVPLWIFSLIYSALGFGINFLGVKNFGKIESLFAIVKLSTLICFIGFGLLFAFGAITPHSSGATSSFAMPTEWLPHGFLGFWTGLIFILFSFGGIEVLGIMANELKNRTEIPKSGSVLLITLTTVYIVSLFLVISMVTWTKIDETESPFVTALAAFNIPYLDSIFNVIIISAAFSTMVGALFGITSIMVSLANDGDAPKRLAGKNKKGVPVQSLLLSAIGLAIAILASYFLPNTVYEYLTTAAGILLVFNWMIILSSLLKLHKTYDFGKIPYKLPFYPLSSYIGITIILFAIIGALIPVNERIGVLISATFIVIIVIAAVIVGKKRKVS